MIERKWKGQQLGISGIALVEVDKVDGGIGQVATQDVEVVAVVGDVGGEVGHRSVTRCVRAFMFPHLGSDGR